MTPPKGRNGGQAHEQSSLRQVSANSRLPMYQQIVLILQDEIMSGVYRAGDLLPSEADLCRIYAVSRITARQALAELSHAGLASRMQGKGTIVREVKYVPPLRASVSKWLDTAREMGKRTQARLVELTSGPANMREAEALGLEPDTLVQRATRVRHQGGLPVSLLHTVLPQSVADLIDTTQLKSTPLLEMLTQAGIVIDRAEQTISAVLANQSTAQLLEADVGSALLTLQRIVYDSDGRPVEYLTAHYRPDRYQLEMVLGPENGLLRLGSSSDTESVIETR